MERCTRRWGPRGRARNPRVPAVGGAGRVVAGSSSRQYKVRKPPQSWHLTHYGALWLQLSLQGWGRAQRQMSLFAMQRNLHFMNLKAKGSQWRISETFSTQKDHSGCTVEARLEEVRVRSRKPPRVVLGEPKLLSSSSGTGTYVKYIKEDLMAEYTHTFLICLLLLYRASVYN